MDHKFQIGYEGPDGKIVMLGDINSIEECELTVTENCVEDNFLVQQVWSLSARFQKKWATG